VDELDDDGDEGKEEEEEDDNEDEEKEADEDVSYSICEYSHRMLICCAEY
jgi:hypothetical protein